MAKETKKHEMNELKGRIRNPKEKSAKTVEQAKKMVSMNRKTRSTESVKKIKHKI